MTPAIRIGKKKRALYTEGVRVHLMGEAPRIGTGWRTLTVLTEGRKWVRVAEVSTGRIARIDAGIWAQITRAA